jgi:hypothetical protein
MLDRWKAVGRSSRRAVSGWKDSGLGKVSRRLAVGQSVSRTFADVVQDFMHVVIVKIASLDCSKVLSRADVRSETNVEIL